MDLIERTYIVAYASQVAAAAVVVALVTAVLLLVWSIHFQGGLSLHSENTDLIINAHSVIMFMGFILVSGVAIITYTIPAAAKRVKKMAHMFLQLVAISMGIFGIHTAFRYHKENEIPDMFTLRSWLGIITICLYGLQWFFGFIFFWLPGTSTITRVDIVPWHTFAGLSVFLMAICTAETGLMQKGPELPGTESILLNFTALGILLFGLIVSLSAFLLRFAVQH